MPDATDSEPEMEHRELHRSGSRIRYWVAGPEDGPLIAFTHGASMDHRMFDAQLSPVTDAGYRVLTWDVRGHGVSKPIGVNFTVPAVADDLLAIIDREMNDREAAVLVGQSFGGYVTQELLFRHPDRVEALVVIGATCLTAPLSRPEQVALKLSPHLFKLWPDRHLRKLIAKSTAEQPDVQRYAHEATRQLSKAEFLTVWKAIVACLHEEPGYRIRKPFLLTHGEHDETGIIAKTAPAWAEREPECRYEVIPDAGHNANQDTPEFFNQLLIEFLNCVSV